MNNGTKIRTFFAALATLVAAYYTYKGLLDDLLNQLGLGKAALIIALIAVIALIVSEAAAAYFNNDFTQEGAFGTKLTRALKADPTLVVDVVDGDEDDDEEDEEGEADAEAEGGDPDEVE